MVQTICIGFVAFTLQLHWSSYWRCQDWNVQEPWNCFRWWCTISFGLSDKPWQSLMKCSLCAGEVAGEWLWHWWTATSSNQTQNTSMLRQYSVLLVVAFSSSIPYSSSKVLEWNVPFLRLFTLPCSIATGRHACLMGNNTALVPWIQ